MLTVIIMLLSISVPCMILLSNTLLSTYNSIALQKLDRSISSCKNYVNSVTLIGQNLALDSEIISILGADNTKPLTGKLNNACDFALTINGITVYSKDSGNIYTSSNVADVPTLETLRTNPNIKDFMDMDSVEYVSLRTDNIPKTYNSYLYNPALGIVSCCRKVFDGGRVVGYILIDIFPSNLYNFFSYDDDRYFEGTIPYISFEKNYFTYNNNDEYAGELAQNTFKTEQTSDKKYLIIPSSRNFYGGSIKIAVPLASYWSNFTAVLLMLIGASIGIITGVHFIARAMASRVDGRMVKLYKKMESHGGADGTDAA